MKYIIYLILASQLMACASASVAQKLNVVSFDEKADPANLQSIGNIEGKDCTWYVMGYGVGEDPTVRNAFMNAVNQKEGSLVPGQKATTKGSPLKLVKHVAVEEGGFNAYVATRRCMIVTGAGFQ
ncbi:hypothetical protein [Bdellovibrio sp. HCB337]|uniref:hypothetical protein n=1 Tax=Bdellovibrio sp. HCB337 TaxID=3394358 RepID=UPI0039A68F6E